MKPQHTLTFCDWCGAAQSSANTRCFHCLQNFASTEESKLTPAFPACQKHQDVRTANGQCYRCNLEKANPTIVSVELVGIIRKAMDRCGFDQALDIKWLIELPMTDAEHRRFMVLIGKPGHSQPNELS